MRLSTPTRMRRTTAVGVGGSADDRVPSQQVGEAGDPAHRPSRVVRTGWAAPTGDGERVAQRAVGVGIPRVRAADEVGAVEHEGPQLVGVPHGERLAEERAVGVAVEVHLADAEVPQDGREVVGCHRGPVQVGPRAQLAAALADRGIAVAAVRLEPRADDRLGQTGSAVVHDQQLSPTEQRPEQVLVVVAAARRGESRPALDRHDRTEARSVLVSAWRQLEVDPEVTPGRRRTVERAPRCGHIWYGDRTHKHESEVRRVAWPGEGRVRVALPRRARRERWSPAPRRWPSSRSP